jgi:HAMP domain-containing protein
MIRFQIQKTGLPTHTAVERQRRSKTVAFVASVALMAQLLSACSNLPTTSAATQYPDLTDPTPAAAAVRADELTQLKAELTRIRDDHERAAAYQQALR